MLTSAVTKIQAKIMGSGVHYFIQWIYKSRLDWGSKRTTAGFGNSSGIENPASRHSNPV